MQPAGACSKLTRAYIRCSKPPGRNCNPASERSACAASRAVISSRQRSRRRPIVNKNLNPVMVMIYRLHADWRCQTPLSGAGPADKLDILGVIEEIAATQHLDVASRDHALLYQGLVNQSWIKINNHSRRSALPTASHLYCRTRNSWISLSTKTGSNHSGTTPSLSPE